MPQALADGGLSWWGDRGTDRTALYPTGLVDHVSTSHSRQHNIPRLSRWCWWLVNSHCAHVLHVYHQRTSYNRDNDAGPSRGLVVCGPGPGAEDQTVLLFSAAQAGRGDMCMVVVCGLHRFHRHGHPPGPARYIQRQPRNT